MYDIDDRNDTLHEAMHQHGNMPQNALGYYPKHLVGEVTITRKDVCPLT